MLIKFSDNPIEQVVGIAFYNRRNILLFTLIPVLAILQHRYLEIFALEPLVLPVVPVSILGGALAIFLGFRNNSAYDRWWEARKIWGGIVNASRSFGTYVITYSSTVFSKGKRSEQEVLLWRKETIHRQIAWLYALKTHLRKEDYQHHLENYLKKKDLEQIRHSHNKPTQLLHLQAKRIQDAFEDGIIEDFRHMEITGLIREFYDLQGKAERIKSTIFPYYYNYFTNVFLWLFILCLPFALIATMGWMVVPMSTAISFVFMILEKSGAITEDPFEGRAADTPISAITRNIEIDLLEMLGSDAIPAPIEPKTTRFGVRFLD